MNEYPSTFDVPAIAGGQDAVLVCMETAFERVLKRWTSTDYIGSSGAVCAIGGIIAADGKTEQYKKAVGRTSVAPANFMGISKFIESNLSNVAQEAIQLLDVSAKELLYWDSGYTSVGGTNHEHPLEAVNQCRGKQAVLRVYEHAIAARQGSLIH